MFLSNWLVFKIVLAAVTGLVDYPLAADVLLVYDNANKLYLEGNSIDYVSNVVLYKGETSYTLGMGDILNKTTTTAYEVALPANSVHATFGINQDATRYVHQYPVADGYQNGKFQVYSGTPSGGYTEYGSPITPFNGDEIINCAMSADGKYILVTTWNGGNDGYKMYKDNGSEYVYHSSYSFIGSKTTTGYNPAFVPSNNNFVITGTDDSSTWHFKLYVYNSATETWTAKVQVTPLGGSSSNYQRGSTGKGFTYDGNYFFQSSNGTTTRGEVWSVDWDANTMTYKWHTTEGSDGDGAGGAISPDNRYVVLCKHTGNPYRVYENMSGDWTTVENVTSQFDLTGSGTSTSFGSYGVGFSGYSSENTTPLYIGQAAGLYGDGKFRLENWAKRSPYEMYITQPGTYRADLQICGIDYKTNEVEVTGTPSDIEVFKEPETDFTANKAVLSSTSSPSYHQGGMSDNGEYYYYGQQVYKKDTGSFTYTAYGSALSTTIFGGSWSSISHDGNYIVSYYTNSTYQLHIIKNNGSTFVNHQTITSPNVSAQSQSQPQFISGPLKHFVWIEKVSGTSNITFHFYKYNSGTDTWSLGFSVTNPTDLSVGVRVYGRGGMSFSKDGNYLAISTGTGGTTETGVAVLKVDWVNETCVKKYENTSVGYWACFLSRDAKYFYYSTGTGTTAGKMLYSANGDWEGTPTDVTSSFTNIGNLGDHSSVFSDRYIFSEKGGSAIYIFKWQDLISPTLTFDNYNKLSLTNTPTYTSSKLTYGSNVYDIGTLTSDITIEKQGEYASLTFDTSSNVAYFSNVTVGAIASTMAGYEKQDQVLDAGTNAGYSNGDAAQGGYGNSIDMSADGTRMVVGNAHYTDSNGRVWLYHLESGSWVLKQTWDGGTRLGSQVAMNEAGTRVFAVSPQLDSQNLGFVRIWDYSSGAWDTSASGTYSISPGTINGEVSAVDCNKAGDVVIIGSGNSSNNTWIYRLSGGSWSSEKNFSRRGSGVSMNGDGTRCFMGDRSSHKVWESNYSGGSWGTETEIISESSFSGYWPASLSTDSAGETVCIKGGDSGNGAIYERAGNGSWSASVSGILSKTELYGTDKVALSYDGTMALFGHTRDSSGALSTGGHALLYTKSESTWTLTQTLLNPSSSQDSNDFFGGGTGLAKTVKDRFVVAAMGDDNAGTNYGAIYTYTNAIPDFISFDTYNKLSLSGITNPTSKLHALPTGAESTTTYDIGTATNIYIESAGTYTVAMKGSSAFALDSNVVGTVTPLPTDYVKIPDIPVDIYTDSSYIRTTTSYTNSIGQTVYPGVKSSFTYNGGAYEISADSCADGNTEGANYQPWHVFTSILGDTTYSYYNTANYVNVPSWLKIKIPSAKVAVGFFLLENRNEHINGFKIQGSNNDSDWTDLYTGTTVGMTTGISPTFSNSTAYQYYRLYVTSLSSSGNNYWRIDDWNMHFFGYVAAPSLNFDTYNKLTFTGADTDSTYKLKYESNTYDLGTISNVYIAYPGTYSAEIKGATNFALSSNVTGGTITPYKVWKENEDQILYGSDPGAGDHFGHAVAVDGNYAVVGSRYNDTGGTDRGAAFIFHKSGGTWTEQAMVQPSDTANDDWFGRGVAISGDYVIVNAYAKTTNNTGQGAAYIFYRSGTSWTQQAKLNASDGEAGDAYSYSVDIDGDYAIVGSLNEDPGGTSNAGSAYIYVRSGTSWSQQAKIQASDKEANDTFGRGVTISGDYAAVGADNEDTSGSNAGSVYIFKYDATTPPDDLPPVDSVGTGFNYKRYTALDTSTHYVYKMWRNSASDWRTPSPASANTIKVLKTDSTDWSDNDTTDTNPEYVDTTTYSGKVSLGQSAGPTENYRFSVPTFGSWSQQQKIQSDDIQADDYFGGGAGQGVSLSGDTLAVGARKEDTGGSEAGSVYIFKKASGSETWSQEAKLQASDVSADSQFGMSVSLSGDILAVGANQEDTIGTDAGAAYIFERSGTTWTEVKRITASDGQANDEFGTSISTDGTTTFVGAYGEDTKGGGAGAAYVYEKVNVLDFDGYNKLTFTGLESGSTSTLKYGSNTYDIGTASNVYISEQGTYEAESKGTTTFALTSNTALNVTEYSSTGLDTVIFSKISGSSWTANSTITDIQLKDANDNLLTIEYFYFPNSNGGNGRDLEYINSSSGTLFSNVTDGSYSLADPVNSTEYAYRNTPDSDKIMSFLSTTFNGYADGTEIIHVKAVSGEVAKVRVVWDREIYRQPMRISNKGKTYDITVGSNSYQGLDETYTLGGTYNATSFISFDTYNKLSIQNITPTSTTLKYGSNTYEIGTATNIYVENTGDYSAEIGNATDFALTNTTVSGTLKTVEPTLSGGYFFGHALTYDGKLYGWGENSSGQAGVGTSSDITVPTLCTGIPQGEVVSIWDQCVSSQNRWAKTRDGKIWVTGEGTQYSIPGQTGDQTSFIDVTSYFGDQSLTANNITQISGQGSRTTMALTETGNVWTWGTHSSSFWNLGQGTGASSSNTPKQITFGGVTDNISRVKLGGTHGVALDTDGDVWFWGQIWANGAGVDYPQATLSDAQKSPHEIMTSNNIIGVSSTYFTIYAWQSDGTYYALGQDSAGQIGDGTATAGGHTSWQKVDYFSANNITINEIYGGAYHVFADTSDGYYCWGGGTHGNLGNGSTGNLASPTKWTNVSNIKVFSSGSYECPYAITEDGKYYAWGNGTNNARGDNTTGDITYPKYIDTLPNILAPSFDYDGYDKVFVNNPYTQGQIVKFSKTTQTWPKQILITDVRIKDKNGNILPIEYIYFPLGNGGPNQDLEYIRPSDSLFSTVTDGSYSSVDSGALRNSPESNRLIHAPDSVYNTYPIGTEWMHVKAMSGSIVQVQIVWDRQQYIQPTKLDADGMTYDIPQGNQSTLAGQDSTYTLTGSYTSEKSSKYTKDTHTYDTKDTQIVTVSDPGTYDAQIKSGTNFNLKSATIPATKTSGLYTWAFHHGNFDNAYGDGDILTARDNGRFYADTPSYTGDIGTITAVNPLVSSNVSFRLNEYTQNDSSDTNTTGIMLTEIDVFDDTNTAMTYGTDYRADLYRAAYADNSGDGGTGKLSDETTPYNEDGSRLNDNVLDGPGGYIGWVNGTYNASATGLDRKYPYSVDDELIRLVPLTGKIIGKVQFAYKGTGTTPGWKVYRGDNLIETTNYAGTDINTQGNQTTHQIADTVSSTTYTFTPASTLTANVLMVAGGGGGGQTSGGSAGGGGAGGLVYTAGTSLAQGATKTIVVGNGGANHINGNDTTFTLLTTTFGGGRGATAGETGGNGGSGGGTSHHYPTSPGTGVSDQGNAGGNAGNNTYRNGGGGGGAGGVGGNASTSSQLGGVGGIGLNYSNVFGSFYGESGWFAGGGAGCSQSTATPAVGGIGGGGYSSTSVSTANALSGQSHTGGGGGGAGGKGGSGIVLLQTNVATPNVNSEVKIPEPHCHVLIEKPDDTQFSHLPSLGNNSVHASGSIVPNIPRADGSVSNVYYSTSTGYFTAAQAGSLVSTVEGIFYPIQQERYDNILEIGHNSTNDVELEMAADGTAKLYRNNGGNELASGTVKCFTVGKWHHIALTLDTNRNAVGYVNGYPVVSATYASAKLPLAREQMCLYRTGVTATFRKFLMYYFKTYNSVLNQKQIMALAGTAGLGPKLEYDGLNAINVVNTEPGSGTEITIYESNVNDTSNLYVVSCNESSYTLSNAGTYYAQIKGTDTFTITRPLTVTDDHFPLYQYPPIDGTTTGLTTSTTTATWTISGVQYSTGSSVAGSPYNTFDNSITSGFDSTSSTGDITITFESSKTIRKYIVWPYDSTSPVSTPGGNTDPTLSTDGTFRPKSWVLYGTNNLNDWSTVLDTVTNQPPSIYGDVHSISSPASYQYYKLSVTANNGGSGLKIGEWQLWGDA